MTFPLPAAADSCPDYCAEVTAALSSHIKAGGSVVELLVEGQLMLRLPVEAYGTSVG